MTKKYEKTAVWLRRDLRLKDNTAISEALSVSETSQLIFCFDKNILEKLPDNDKRLTFIIEALTELNEESKELGGELIILHGDPAQEVPKYLKKEKFEALFFNEDYEPYALNRDKKVTSALEIPTFKFTDQLIFHPLEVLKKDGTPYKVFTPFKNAWLDKLEDHKSRLKINKLPSKSKLLGKEKPEAFSKKDWYKKLGFEKQNLVIPTGRSGAKKTLGRLKTVLPTYAETRDLLTEKATSKLSPYLRHGLIGLREVISYCFTNEKNNSPTFVSELVWREFYMMILFHFPHVEKSSFKPQYDKIKWLGGKKELDSWKKGMTGFPIVDSAMRCLNETGLMPNRLRMVTASFLCKTLLVNWQEGEKYFAEKLLDYDLSANSGGWQWSSSSGCDSQPYFRIFNPVSQSKKFDPKGDFIKKWCPELDTLTEKEVHEPNLLGPLILAGKGIDYPTPVVDYKQKRQEALDMYKSAVK